MPSLKQRKWVGTVKRVGRQDFKIGKGALKSGEGGLKKRGSLKSEKTFEKLRKRHSKSAEETLCSGQEALLF